MRVVGLGGALIATDEYRPLAATGNRLLADTGNRLLADNGHRPIRH